MEVTQNWNQSRLGDISFIKTGTRNNQDKQKDGRYPFYVRSQDIERIDTYSYMDEAILIPGEGNIGSIVHYVNEPHEVHQRVYRISEFNSQIHPLYVYWFLKEFFRAHTEKYTVKATVDSLRLPTFQDFIIDYPTLPEQQAIAKALSDIDELIENIKMELQKKRNFRIAIAQELLSKAKGSNIKLGEYAEFSKGNNLPKSALSETGSTKAIHYGELFTHYPEKIKQIKSRTNLNSLPVVLSRANDVLMPTSDVTPNGLATASCISEGGVVLGGDILIVRTDPSLVDGTYLSYVIRNSKDKVLKLVNGTTVYHLYGKDLSNFEFILPSISYQRETVDVLEILGEEISLLDVELVKYECIKQGMAHDLLTGKVRLV
jgi:type I restriction enzyme S subunit